MARKEKMKKKLGVALIIVVGLSALFWESFCGEVGGEENRYLYVSEIITSDENYAGNLIQYTLPDMKKINSIDVLFDALDINMNFTSLIGSINEKGICRIEKYDLETYKNEVLFSNEKIKDELKKNGIEKDMPRIESIKFIDDKEHYSFVSENILWKVTDKGIEPLIKMDGNCYEWMTSNEILIEQEGEIVLYNLEKKKSVKAFPECKLDGDFVVSNDKKTMVYEGGDKHGLYKYSFEAGEIEYLSSLSGTAEIVFSRDDNCIVYCDRYFTLTHSGAAKLYIMDLNTKRKKMIKNYHEKMVGRIVCG